MRVSFFGLGVAIVVVALIQGFGVEATWYWWPVLGFGVGLSAAALVDFDA